MFWILNLLSRRAQLASSLLVVIGRDRQFRKAIYPKEVIDSYRGGVLLSGENMKLTC